MQVEVPSQRQWQASKTIATIKMRAGCKNRKKQ